MDSSEASGQSKTAVHGCCKVCGAPEEKDKRFLICDHSLCSYRYYHIRCLTPEQIASEAQLDNPCWYCPSCLCRVCLCDMDDDQIILCDGCDEGYHMYCLSPPRLSVPKGNWFCPSCQARKATEAKFKEYEKKMLSLHRKNSGAIVKSDKFRGVDLLLSAAEELAGEPQPRPANEAE